MTHNNRSLLSYRKNKQQRQKGNSGVPLCLQGQNHEPAADAGDMALVPLRRIPVSSRELHRHAAREHNDAQTCPGISACATCSRSSDVNSTTRKKNIYVNRHDVEGSSERLPFEKLACLRRCFHAFY